MKILLLKDVKGIGTKGQEREVKEGYALNFLIPHNIALPSTSQNKNQIEKQQKSVESKKEKLIKLFKENLKKIDGETFKIKPITNENGRLFKAVSTDEVLSVLLAKVPSIEKMQPVITFGQQIKARGDYSVGISFPQGISGTITLRVE
jgi:large subunit ribosomal protein L9